MEEKTVNFLKQTFSEYYKQNKSRIAEPSRIHEREFGYWPFDGFMPVSYTHLTLPTICSV